MVEKSGAGNAGRAGERDMIGKLLFGAVLAAGVGYGYPLVNEHAVNACQALERRVIAMQAPAAPLQRPARAIEWAVARIYLEPLSDGRIAAAQAKQRYPALPADVGCAVGYWTTLLNSRA
jgi:hypothetical protein